MLKGNPIRVKRRCGAMPQGAAMADDREMIRVLMSGLVRRVGGVEAAAAAIRAATGREPSKGSISKRMSGELSWPGEEIWALENVVGDHCVTDWRNRQRPEVAAALTLMQGVADAARESGEALAAAMQTAMNGRDRAAALKEVREAMAAMARIADQLEQGGAA